MPVKVAVEATGNTRLFTEAIKDSGCGIVHQSELQLPLWLLRKVFKKFRLQLRQMQNRPTYVVFEG